MVITKLCPLIILLSSGSALSREATSPAQCQALASHQPISGAIAKARDLSNVQAQATLADAWSDAGCYDEAVTTMQSAVNVNPGIAELQTRLRVARSLVGEEHFFDDLDRADKQAKVKRDAFRCDKLQDLDACDEAVRLDSDDPALLISRGDALLRAKRPLEALQQYRRAEPVAPDKQALIVKIRAAETQLPTTSQDVAASANSASSSVTAAAATHTAIQTAAVRSDPVQGVAKPASRLYSNTSPQGQSH